MKCKSLPEVIFVLGPTASGKTDVAARLAVMLDGEVISCDSMQIYEAMGILTQAPPRALTEKVPHHMVGVLAPEEECDAVRYASLAREVIEELLSAGRKAVVAGGTGLYVRALLDGIFSSPGKDELYREGLRAEASEKGSAHLHRKLVSVDPASAEEVHPNDLRRIIRALEIYHLTGRTRTELARLEERRASFPEYRLFGLDLPREELYRRIDGRVDEMVRSGVIDEVSSLMGRRLGRTASKALGFREFRAYIKGDSTIEDACALVKKNTRNYAKRQLTWFRADERIEWVDASRPADDIADDIMSRSGMGRER